MEQTSMVFGRGYYTRLGARSLGLAQWPAYPTLKFDRL